MFKNAIMDMPITSMASLDMVQGVIFHKEQDETNGMTEMIIFYLRRVSNAYIALQDFA